METLEDYLSNNQHNFDRNDFISLKELAYGLLKDAIKHADLDRDAPISELRLSRLLGISRTPIREALQQLSSENLVEIIPGRAVKIAKLSIQEVLDTLYIRSMLEPEVAKLVAETITGNQIGKIWNIFHEMEVALENRDRTAWKRADSYFHEFLCGICPNMLLGKMAIQSRDRISYLSASPNITQDRLVACTSEHKAIIEALASRNPELANKEFSDHINLLHESIIRRFAPKNVSEAIREFS